jgi:curved DNA-binding protein CbpA
LLDVRPDDDAEGLKQAFRKAVKASHPDVHTDDPDAPTRFRHFVQAYAILRDPERRADYDRLLELERQQLRANSYTMRKFAFDAIAIAGFAAMMVGGYPLYTHISKTFEAVAVVEVPARGLPEIAAVEPAARTDTTDRDEPRGKLVVPDMATAPSAVASADAGARSGQMAPISPRHYSGRADGALESPVNALSPHGPESITTGPSHIARPGVMDSGLAGQRTAPRNDDGWFHFSGTSSSGEAPGIADGGPALSSAGRDTEVAKIANAVDAPVDRAGTMTAAHGRKENSGIEPLDQKNARPVEVQPSSLEKDGNVPKSLSSVFWTEKRDVKTRDIKTPDMKTPERPRVVAKRQATGQPPLKQVSLESRSTSVSSHAAPVFGVGF